MIPIVTTTYFATRRCNLRCSYCQIVRPNKYNQSAWDNELDLDGKLKVLTTLKKLNSGFNILMGGEILLLGEQLVEMVRLMNRENIPYAIASNSTEPFISKWFDKLIEVGIRNWSVSLDTITTDVIKVPDKHVLKKSNEGLYWLLKFKENGVKDLHATITLTSKNLDEIIPTIIRLSKLDVWCEITTLTWKKNEFYDFGMGTETMKDYILKPEDYIKFCNVLNSLKEMKASGKYLIHNSLDYFDEAIKYGYDANWMCDNPYNSLVVDADGGVRTCRDIRGSSKIKVWDLLEDEKRVRFEMDFRKDFKNLCQGCFWDCKFDSEGQYKKLGLKNAQTGFQHTSGRALI